MVFFYAPDRGGQNAEEFLRGFDGILQFEGYASYDRLTRATDKGGNPIRDTHQLAQRGPLPHSASHQQPLLRVAPPEARGKSSGSSSIESGSNLRCSSDASSTSSTPSRGSSKLFGWANTRCFTCANCRVYARYRMFLSGCARTPCIARARDGLRERSDRARPIETKGSPMNGTTEGALASVHKRSFDGDKQICNPDLPCP
ncbi:IS66 family transposase [Meridianimarinicoccus sp. RP-17]|uniref:IS66 family transposase n=1 Tax=Meridianimarinicoccus zhengii TaxID=2056810 RepID=UPI0037449D1B